MKIKDIIAGLKPRADRNERKRRLKRSQSDNLYKVDIKHIAEEVIRESGRIQHIEDLVLWSGSQGVKKAIASLKELESSPSSTTIKWDGSPAVIFGRNEAGEFVLTDKSGFGAKGYDGKVTSADDMEQMFLNRGKGPADAGRAQFAAKMKSVWGAFESATPADFRGYVHGDLLYFTTPEKDGDAYVFTPNTTTYKVKANSDIGKRIAQSQTGVVLHAKIDLDGNTERADASQFGGNELLVMPPAVVTQAPDIKNDHLSQVEAQLSKFGSAIDNMLNVPAELKMKDLPTIFYTYINNKTKAGTLDTLGKDFSEWLGNSKVSAPKQKRVLEWLQDNSQGFTAMFTIIVTLMQVKNEIIDELDNQPADIEAYTAGKRGGEGYVIGKDVKLVNRTSFTQANMSKER